MKTWVLIGKRRDNDEWEAFPELLESAEACDRKSVETRETYRSWRWHDMHDLIFNLFEAG